MPIQSSLCSTTFQLPAGARLHSVRGEADGKPTYDFVMQLGVWDPVLAAPTYLEIKYAGTKNGGVVNLWKDWPQISTRSITAPAALGDTVLIVTTGVGIVLQVYYVSGLVAV